MVTDCFSGGGQCRGEQQGKRQDYCNWSTIKNLINMNTHHIYYQEKWKLTLELLYQKNIKASSEDGFISRYGSPLNIITSKSQLKYRTLITQELQKSSWMEIWQLRNWRNYIHPEWWEVYEHGMCWPHTQVDKNLGGIPWELESQTHTRSPSPVPGIPTTSGCQNQWGLGWWRRLLEP